MATCLPPFLPFGLMAPRAIYQARSAAHFQLAHSHSSSANLLRRGMAPTTDPYTLSKHLSRVTPLHT